MSPRRPSTMRWQPGSTISMWRPSTAGPRSCWDRRYPRCGTGSSWPARRSGTVGEGVRAQLEESLGLLNCDRFDLYQLHAVTDLDELDARADAVEAIMSARDEGLCRWVGITGHNLTAPAAHLEALRRYDLDTVMFPVNPRLWSDPPTGATPRRCWPTPPSTTWGSWPSRRPRPGPGTGGRGARAPGMSPTRPPRRSLAGSASRSRPPASTLLHPGEPGRAADGRQRRRCVPTDGCG